MGRLRLAVILCLTAVWAFLCHHYYSVLATYAGLEYYLSHPVLYVGVEAMWLWCVTILTWLALKTVKEVTNHARRDS